MAPLAKPVKMDIETTLYDLPLMNRLNARIARIAFVAVLIALLSGCLRTPAGNDDEHATYGAIFRHRWWNYYARALEGADQQVYDAAKRDLAAALTQRDGDRRMARTYGMHFIDYFPHRELGVIHWLEGDLEAARRELEQSISQYPSAKARYYLDLVRKAYILRSGERVVPPELIVTSISEGIYRTSDDPVVVSGLIRDPNYVAAISVAGIPLYLEGTTKRRLFEKRLTLPQGHHAIAVTATNLAGIETTRTISIHVDRQGPLVIVESVQRTNDDIVFKGVLFDEAGIATLSLNEERVDTEAGTRSTFSHRVPHGMKSIVFRASDRLGNTTVVPIASDALKTSRTEAPLIAAVPSNLVLAGIFGGRDRTPPQIRLGDWQASQVIYMDQVVLSGSVRDSGRVTGLKINGTPVLPHPGAMVLFSHFLRLTEGINRISIEAEDASGNTAIEQIVIERRTPKVRLLSERLRMSVFAFERSGDVSDISFAFQDNFIHQLVQLDRFQLIERDMLEQILQEQNISRSRLIDRPTAVRLGRLAAAHAIVAGSIVETRTGIEIIGRVIDSETSEILVMTDAYGEEKSMAGLKDLAKILALKIHREFPLVDGMVVDRHDNVIMTDLGSKKIRAQRHIMIYEDRPVRHPATGKPLGKDCRILGTARVVQADADLSKAELEPGCAETIRPRHKVMTR